MHKFITLLMVILFSSSSFSQNNNYLKLWNEVESFEVEGLPKSALEIVETIESKAKNEKNSAQLIKVLLFKSKFMLILEEDAQLNIINAFKTEISKSSTPTKNVLQNILASIYWQYFNKNRYKFYNRTKTKDKVNATDFRTWDLQTLFNKIHLLYDASLKSGLILQQTNLKNYNTILSLEKDSKKYRPTLFDFLAHNALKFYKTQEKNITKPEYKFKIDNANYLANINTFKTLKITSKDTSSLELKALKLYQELINFHTKDKNPLALTTVNIDRLNFVHDNLTLKNKNELLAKTLKAESKNITTHEASGLYDYKLASLYNNEAQKYNAKTNPIFQYKNKDAIALCDNVISKFPESKAAQNCKNLKKRITNPTLTIENEAIVPINTTGKFLVRHKNIDTLYFTAYQLNEKQYKSYSNLYREEEQNTFINKLKVHKTWNTALKNEKDFQQHNSEVVFPSLNNGRYLIIAKTTNFEENFLAKTIIQTTNIAIVEYDYDGTKQFQFINRNNGKPIENAKVEYNYFYYNDKKDANETVTGTTNAKGQHSIKKRNNDRRYLNIKVTTENDSAYFENFYIRNYHYGNNYNDKNAKHKAFIFTDRSIYRPGQTVYFKGIIMQTKDEKSKVLPNQKVIALLRNTNNEIIKELKLKTNEYGSVASEFILPNNTLTGTFNIILKDNKNFSGYHHFSVEEYKRPKFETNFKPITKTLKVNDSVTVTGEAIAYAGSKISNAKVVYRVKRKIEYPRWYYWRKPNLYNQSQEITHGETTTNENGEYNITFKAIPGENASKENLPIFKYEVTADVTDINGETRSTNTTINVGYHTLTANIIVKKLLDKHEKNHVLAIDTKNLNNEFVPAKGNIKIYKLNAPETVLRPRPWLAGDYKNLTKKEFKSLFPHEAYQDEHLKENWEKGELVYNKTFDTNKNKELALGNIKKWQSGEYLILLETKDKHKQLVKDEAKITLYSDNDKTVADNQLFSITTNKDTYNSNDSAKITFGTAAKNLWITVDVEKNHKIISTEIIQLNNNKKTITIPVTKEDIGGFKVHYSYAAFNSYKNGNITINVPYPKSNLEIETLTFRDKLQPGSKETWQFKIKGTKGDKVTAEVLASMYDASLNQFKQHNWLFNPIQHHYYSTSIHKNANRSFKENYFNIKRNYSYNYYQNPQQFDALNWFGFSLNNNRWQYKNYISRLKAQRKNYDKEISGIITDEVGLPLPGVNVIIKGTSFGTQTNFDGEYYIKVKKEDVLEFSFIGYKKVTFKANNHNHSFAMETDENSLDEVVVTAYGTSKKKAVTGAIASDMAPEAEAIQSLSGKVSGLNINNSNGLNDTTEITLRGNSSLSSSKQALIVIDGKVATAEQLSQLKTDSIISTNVLKGAQATALYGSRGANGVLIVTTKNNPNANFNEVKIRKNLQETAFFFPQLTTDSKGNVSFNFIAPEALTQWKLQLLAHTKTLEHATTSLVTVTQKDLMVLPNTPRFLREGDTINISTKISNLANKNLSGIATLQLFDALTGKSIDAQLANTNNMINFSVNAQSNTQVNWQLHIPNNIQAIQYKIIAKSGNYSDGEQNALPVLTNRMLVTETLPMWVKSNQTKTFTLNKLKTNTSKTLKNHKLTLEITSNPAWYAIQALPYLMEYPYECNEQTFSRYYANALASHIVNSNPKIKTVFNQWKNTNALLSNLEKNQELKSILIQETPWLRDAQNETEQKKRIALLFDLNKMNDELSRAKIKLKNNQLSSGAWSWFGNYKENRYITQHIIAGFGHLIKLNVDQTNENPIINKAINYLDTQFIKEYKDIRKYDKNADLTIDRLSNMQLHYLYMRSFFPDNKPSKEVEKIIDYYHSQIKKYWLKRSLYQKAMMALITHRLKDENTSKSILKSLKENSITSEELGMYWKENTSSWHWYQAPIETQALIIEAFSEIENNTNTIDNLKTWLLKNKQTSQWKTTKATTEAVYALLLQGSDWLSVTDMVDVVLGGKPIEAKTLEQVNIEAGTGYYKTSWNTTEIKPEMAEVKLTKKENGIAWGSLYWQYFEDLDKITSAKTPLQLSKKLFKKTNTDKGEVITDITRNTKLKVGDLIRVRIELRSDRNMEFVHLKDMRAAGLEPVNVLSNYKYQDGLGYYEATKDASTNFFFDYLPKGIYVFEYDLRINNTGNMSNGITTIQSMYAPEFTSHSEGTRIKVE